MPELTACEDQETHHSDDLIEVYTGRTEPTLLCGFHVMKRGL